MYIKKLTQCLTDRRANLVLTYIVVGFIPTCRAVKLAYSMLCKN